MPTDQGKTGVQHETCAGWAECSNAQGVATCRPKKGRCMPGATECVGADKRRQCDVAGNWKEYACGGCASVSFGAVCRTLVPTASYSGVVNHESFGPNPTLADWSTTPFKVPAQDGTLHERIVDGTSLEVHATITGEGYGAAATAAHRFGHAQPKLPERPRSRVHLTGGPER